MGFAFYKFVFRGLYFKIYLLEKNAVSNSKRIALWHRNLEIGFFNMQVIISGSHNEFFPLRRFWLHIFPRNFSAKFQQKNSYSRRVFLCLLAPSFNLLFSCLVRHLDFCKKMRCRVMKRRLICAGKKGGSIKRKKILGKSNSWCFWKKKKKRAFKILQNTLLTATKSFPPKRS